MPGRQASGRQRGWCGDAGGAQTMDDSAFMHQRQLYQTVHWCDTGVFAFGAEQKVEPWIIANFGFQSSKKVDKWSITKYHVKDGLPYLDDNIATLKCEVVQSISYESNTLFLAEVVDCEDNKNEEPLTYNDYRAYFKQDVMDSFNKLKSAVKEKKMAEENKKDEGKHWVCLVCGYVYDGDVPFEELPEDWVCPLCGVGKDQFAYE